MGCLMYHASKISIDGHTIAVTVMHFLIGFMLTEKGTFLGVLTKSHQFHFSLMGILSGDDCAF